MSMRIGGFGELEQYRRAMRKDDARPAPGGKSAAAGAGEGANAQTQTDAVQISPETRMRAKLQAIPQVRQEKVDAARRKLESGELDQPEVVERSVRRMVENLVNGDL